ncbi:hypothetical protein [Frigidibacter sp. ROC022]|nr:hypothetical protein [Frigidibacter sp. ROC022]MCR8725463.1 hypothetical protein [Frigidibacter sp. ROC022]
MRKRFKTVWMGRRLRQAFARNARMVAELDRLLRHRGLPGP